MFLRAQALLEEYYAVVHTDPPQWRTAHLIGEARARLRDLDYIYVRILTIEEGMAQLMGVVPRNLRSSIESKTIQVELGPPLQPEHRTTPQGFTSDDELRTLLEHFYWSAARLRDLIRDSARDLPYVSGFEATGVRDVRNHLVEHPTGKRGVPVYSFAFGGPVGPQLKPVRLSSDEPGTLDEGLQRNASQLAGSLERVFALAISRAGA